MSNYYEHSFFRIDFDVVPSYIELPWFKQYIIVSWCIGELLEYVFEIDELDPAHLLAAPRFASQAALKRTKVKLDLLTDIDVMNGRKRYQGRNMLHYLLTCKN